MRVWSDRVFPGNPYRSGNNPAAQRAALPFGLPFEKLASGGREIFEFTFLGQ